VNRRVDSARLVMTGRFGAIFSKLTQYGYNGWAVMEWECCIKSSSRAQRREHPLLRRTSSAQQSGHSLILPEQVLTTRRSNACLAYSVRGEN